VGVAGVLAAIFIAALILVLPRTPWFASREGPSPVVSYFAAVAVERVEIRTQPNGAGVLIATTSGELNQLVYVLDHLQIGGETWLRVEFSIPRGSARFGWMPAKTAIETSTGTTEVDVLVNVTPSCKSLDTGDVLALALQPPAVRFACAGRREVVLRPAIVKSFSRSDGVRGAPEWLASSRGLYAFGEHGWESNDQPLELHVDPILGKIPTEVWVELSGHFGDPEATSCRREADDPAFAVGSPSEQVLWCSQQFVVSSFKRIDSPVPSPSPTAPPMSPGSWATLPTAPLDGRQSHSAVWTGHELLVWGGEVLPRGPSDMDPYAASDGAAYEPITRTWREIPDAPIEGRAAHSAFWTGVQMIVWGGRRLDGWAGITDGAAYNPTTNEWRDLPKAPFSTSGGSLAVWTGSSLVVIAGLDEQGGATLAEVAAYDPALDTWVALPDLPLPSSISTSAAWDGREVVVAANPAEGSSVLWTLDVDSGWQRLPEPPFNGRNVVGGIFATQGTIAVPTTGLLIEDGSGIADQLFLFSRGGSRWTSAQPPGGWHGSGYVEGDGTVYFWPALAYSVDSGVWRRLPPVADRSRSFASLTWTGSQIIAWGGASGESPFAPADGIEFTPAGAR
jgi:hypothetical protein